MKGKGFEVQVKDSKGEVVIDRPVNTRMDGTGWCKNYVESMGPGQEATFYVDGKPVETHYRQR